MLLDFVSWLSRKAGRDPEILQGILQDILKTAKFWKNFDWMKPKFLERKLSTNK